MSQPTIADHLLVLLLGVVVPLVGVLRHQPSMKREEFDSAGRISFAWNGAVSLALMGATVLVAWWLREGSFAGLGLGPPRGGLVPAAVLSLLFACAYLLHLWWRTGTPARLAATRERWERDTPFMPRSQRELRHFGALALSAGVFEEIVFRGLLVSYVAWYTGPELSGLALAVALPALVFGFAHLYQGAPAALLIATMASAFGAIYLATGSLWIPILLHALVDLFSAWLGVRVITRASEEVR